MATERMTPGQRYELVTKGVAMSGNARALLIGTAGTINLTRIDGTEVDGITVPVGCLPLECSAVRSGGTADDITAILYD